MQGEEVQEVHKEKTVNCLSAKEMKALIKPEFQKNPEKYYPVETFKKIGFSRAQCKCGHFFWRKSQSKKTCGDSNCEGKYSFIGTGHGIGKSGKKLSYVGAWQTFKKSLTSTRIPCTAIDRYPVVARWRNDVDYVAAGIYCFQPYCVTGQLQPPANPLICPQFSVRFNDLDNIGLTGRHYSGFVMLGIQVFNKPQNYIFFKEECVQFNYRWLTEELMIDPQQITFIQDIWAGGGNLGPSVQYFVGGLEIGNMVFMQYKYFHDGRIEQLSVKVIDVGIGLERIPWLINGSPTSYYDVFTNSFEFLSKKLGIVMNNEVWEKLGPYSSRLDIDESEDIDKTWSQISNVIDVPLDVVKKQILPLKQLYVILDHTRTALVIIQDGGLPSNVGGGSNCRNIVRRVFAVLHKNGWWDKIGGLDGLLELFDHHRSDLQKLFGKAPQYKSFNDIIKIQYERWASTESSQKTKLQQLIQKNKGKLTIDNWIMAMQSWGIPADAIADISKTPIPGNLYLEIANRQQKIGKAQEQILYDTIQFPQTDNLYYKDHRQYEFSGKILGVFQNVVEKQKGNNIVILDRSAFYPTSGGQVNDIGTMIIKYTQYQVYNVEKVGRCVLHFLNKAVNPEEVVGSQVIGKIDQQRRGILRCFHTGTHIVFAACRRVLGPHIWQHGAKKTVDHAHLDITHYSSITKQAEMEIENQANRIILQGHPIKKYFESKSEAEKQFGFRLYQGGIVPGNSIRIVNITDVDVEACCGTHADNTAQVGWIKIIKSARISDGTLRLYYVAGKKVLKALNEQTSIINQLKDMWGITQAEIVPTATRFFNQNKKFDKQIKAQKLTLLSMSTKLISESQQEMFIIYSLQKKLTLYISSMDTHLAPVILKQKTVFFINDTMLFCILSNPNHLNLQELKGVLKQDEDPQVVDKKFVVKKGIEIGKGKEKIKKQNASQVIFTGKVKDKKVIEFLQASKFELLK